MALNALAPVKKSTSSKWGPTSLTIIILLNRAGLSLFLSLL